MFNRTIRQALIIAFSLTISGLASARNPPALVKQQAGAAHASKSSSGYRDINWRFGDISARAPEVMRESGGYRDIHYRFGRATQLPTHAASVAKTSRWR